MFGFLGRSQRSSHRFCQDNLSAFIDGQLPARDRERVRRHLEQCQECRWHLRTMESTIRAVRSLPQLRAPRSFHIPHSAPVPSLPIWMRPWVYGALRTATAAVAVALIVTLAGNALTSPSMQAFGAPAQAVPRAAPAGVESTAPVEALAAPSQPAAEGTPAPPPEAKGTLLFQGTPTARGRLPATAVPAAAAPTPPPAALPNDTPAPLPTQEAGAGAPRDREAAAQTAAPKGMGGEEMRPSAGAAAATAPALAAVPQVAGTPDAARRDAEGLTTTTERPSEAYQIHGAQLPMLQRVQRQIGGYPWHLWAIGTGVLFAPLLVLTLWLRAVRARWP